MPPGPRRLWRKPKLWQLALACSWLTLFIATHLPAGTPGLPGEGIDKLTHLAAFAVLSAIFAATWEFSSGRLTWRHLLWAWLIITAYGAFDEWTQDFVGRNTSAADWLADATGAALGLFVFIAVRRTLVERGARREE
jgi:VanZ family protein